MVSEKSWRCASRRAAPADVKRAAGMPSDAWMAFMVLSRSARLVSGTIAPNRRCSQSLRGAAVCPAPQPAAVVSKSEVAPLPSLSAFSAFARAASPTWSGSGIIPPVGTLASSLMLFSMRANRLCGEPCPQQRRDTLPWRCGTRHVAEVHDALSRDSADRQVLSRDGVLCVGALLADEVVPRVGVGVADDIVGRDRHEADIAGARYADDEDGVAKAHGLARNHAERQRVEGYAGDLSAEERAADDAERNLDGGGLVHVGSASAVVVERVPRLT